MEPEFAIGPKEKSPRTLPSKQFEPAGRKPRAGQAHAWTQYFYWFMALLITVVVGWGFSRTVNEKLIRPAIPRPFVLYVHAAIFSGWVAFFIWQSALVRMGHVRLHRWTGWLGSILGAAVAMVGIATAVTMGRFNVRNFHSRYAGLALLVSFYDIAAFAVPFALAVYWRRKPEFHRRLMLVATCALTAAAFGRLPIPPHVPPAVFFYTCVDLLILLGVARDLVVDRCIHPVYRWALPAFLVCQVVVVYTVYHHSPYWLNIAQTILN
jgi:hypothetical protein